MFKFTGNAWNVSQFSFYEHEDKDGRLLYRYTIEGERQGHTFYGSLEEAMAEAIGQWLTGTTPQAFGRGTGSAAQWFLAACKYVRP